LADRQTGSQKCRAADISVQCSNIVNQKLA